MPRIYSPATWQMTAAQLITPTTSGLSTINAMQTAVAATTNWSVTTSGTTTAGYKYFEAAPVGSTLYSEYRILFVERINTSTNKTTVDGQTPWNLATYVLIRFVPDGGRTGVTFTPANIETANDCYVGSNYKSGTNTVWHSIASPWTATWLYTCDGAMWIINRSSATSHNILGFGHVFVPVGGSLYDNNGAGTEVGVPGFVTRRALGAVTMAGNFITGTSSSGAVGFWYYPGTSARTPAIASSLALAFC